MLRTECGNFPLTVQSSVYIAEAGTHLWSHNITYLATVTTFAGYVLAILVHRWQKNSYDDSESISKNLDYSLQSDSHLMLVGRK
jgi:hypothetical protein